MDLQKHSQLTFILMIELNGGQTGFPICCYFPRIFLLKQKTFQFNFCSLYPHSSVELHHVQSGSIDSVRLSGESECVCLNRNIWHQCIVTVSQEGVI